MALYTLRDKAKMASAGCDSAEADATERTYLSMTQPIVPKRPRIAAAISYILALALVGGLG